MKAVNKTTLSEYLEFIEEDLLRAVSIIFVIQTSNKTISNVAMSRTIFVAVSDTPLSVALSTFLPPLALDILAASCVFTKISTILSF